jgi:hypothetical protein
MEKCTYPFPLAANSSHHSHYHRFLLGADASVLAPFPKPVCVGALAGSMRRLTENLDLQRWRKLFHASIPWVEGFGPGHYDLGNVAPHRPLPPGYRRPARRFGAFDFVQVADPAVSALALVAGDRRIIERFILLGNDFCSRLESGAQARHPGPSGTRATGRLLVGQFLEPSNRWLMPFLHLHARVLNFTSFEEAPARLACIDPAALAREGERARHPWVGAQAEALSDLGYRVAVCGGVAPALRVDGVSDRLVAAMEAPRIAVLRLVERMVLGEREACAERFAAELPQAVIAAMAEQLESILARSLSAYKPAKIGIPSEGPWRAAVREHMGRSCPGDLALLDAAAARARAVPCESAIFPTPPLDPAHVHAPTVEALDAGIQLPEDPELGAGSVHWPPERSASPWLLRQFEETLREVNDRLVRAGVDDPLVSLRGLLRRIDHPAQGADPEQLRQSALFLGSELDRRERQHASGVEPGWRGGAADRAPLSSLDDLFEGSAIAQLACEREIGGRSL